MSPLAFSVKGAAEACGLSASHLRNAIAAGQLVAKVTSRREDGRAAKTVVLADDLRAYLEGLEDA